jgi:hypothetical protein
MTNNIPTEFNFLTRKNRLLEDKIMFLKYRIRDTPQFKYMKAILKNKKKTGEVS